MKKAKKVFWWLVFLIIPLVFIGYVLKTAKNYPAVIDLKHEPDFFGITYSKKYAENIGLDWQETYLSILDELNVKYVRIPVYWDQIEKQPGAFDFSDYDFLIQEGEKSLLRFEIGRDFAGLESATVDEMGQLHELSVAAFAALDYFVQKQQDSENHKLKNNNK